MQLNDDYILLLNKAFTGEIHPDESARLATWMQQSPENEQLATELRQIWDATGAPQLPFNADLESGFARVRQRIRTVEPAPLRVVSVGRRLMQIAAVLFFLMAAVWAWQRSTTPAVANEIASATDTDKRLIQLPDGSQVWLRRGATLEYPATFGAGERRVKLNGEAFFEVSHNPQQPFRVELPANGYVQVLGTQFNVSAREQGDEAAVLVCSGKVHYSPDGRSAGATLTGNQKAVFNRSQSKVKVAQVATLNELAWQTGGLEFVSTPLTAVIADLEQYYKVKITLRNAELGNCTYTAPLTSQPVEQVLASLALTYQMRLKTPAAGTYILEGGNCR